MADIIAALVAGFSTMATNAMDGIAEVLPVVLPIMAAIIVIRIIVRVVNRISTGRS